jgi:uncharacterized membrane protein
VSWQPLWDDGALIALHALLALAAMALGAVQFAAPKGTLAHRVLGYLWVGAMAIVAGSSFWIHSFRWVGPFSAIHALSALVLVTLVYALRAVRRGNVAGHRRAMVQLYALALLLAGAFTLLPRRTMHAVVFGG